LLRPIDPSFLRDTIGAPFGTVEGERRKAWESRLNCRKSCTKILFLTLPAERKDS
jgi:hypothetical protein